MATIRILEEKMQYAASTSAPLMVPPGQGNMFMFAETPIVPLFSPPHPRILATDNPPAPKRLDCNLNTAYPQNQSAPLLQLSLQLC